VQAAASSAAATAVAAGASGVRLGWRTRGAPIDREGMGPGSPGLRSQRGPWPHAVSRSGVSDHQSRVLGERRAPGGPPRRVSPAPRADAGRRRAFACRGSRIDLRQPRHLATDVVTVDRGRRRQRGLPLGRRACRAIVARRRRAVVVGTSVLRLPVMIIRVVPAAAARCLALAAVVRRRDGRHRGASQRHRLAAAAERHPGREDRGEQALGGRQSHAMTVADGGRRARPKNTLAARGSRGEGMDEVRESRAGRAGRQFHIGKYSSALIGKLTWRPIWWLIDPADSSYAYPTWTSDCGPKKL